MHKNVVQSLSTDIISPMIKLLKVDGDARNNGSR